MHPSNMGLFYKTCAFFLVFMVTFTMVNSQTAQPISSIEKQLRANLTNMVQFIVHPSAKPSRELINFALSSGGRPQTDTERMVYLGILGRIARNNPGVIQQFVTMTTNPDGTQSQSLDEIGLGVHITRKAVEYVQTQHSSKAFAGVPVLDIVNSMSSNSTGNTTTV